jgi:hypothetical protein
VQWHKAVRILLAEGTFASRLRISQGFQKRHNLRFSRASEQNMLRKKSGVAVLGRKAVGRVDAFPCSRTV